MSAWIENQVNRYCGTSSFLLNVAYGYVAAAFSQDFIDQSGQTFSENFSFSPQKQKRSHFPQRKHERWILKSYTTRLRVRVSCCQP